jgi:hypothetical protein
MLTHLWAQYHDVHSVADKIPQATSKLDQLEALAREGLVGKLKVDEYQAAQSEYLAEIQARGNPWRVTDFITLGSPLTHATVLMARNEEEFARKKQEREFPTCPPVLEDIVVNKVKQKKFSFEKGRDWIPHHGAVFAPTRWTNLYFPCHHTFWGDLIGGPIAPAFGAGVLDMAVNTKIRGGLLSHTLYWSLPAEGVNKDVPSWIERF